MTHAFRTATAAVVLASTLALPAMAGEFSVSCSFSNENLRQCATVINDLVTDKFLAKYPASRFQIFVHSNIVGFTSGGYGAYAVAGVIPAGSGRFPVHRFSSTNINGSNTKFSQIDLAKTELSTYRAAVRNLMERCEISPTCDVDTPE